MNWLNEIQNLEEQGLIFCLCVFVGTAVSALRDRRGGDFGLTWAGRTRQSIHVGSLQKSLYSCRETPFLWPLVMRLLLFCLQGTKQQANNKTVYNKSQTFLNGMGMHVPVYKCIHFRNKFSFYPSSLIRLAAPTSSPCLIITAKHCMGFIKSYSMSMPTFWQMNLGEKI